MKEKISKSKLKKSQILNKFPGYFLKKECNEQTAVIFKNSVFNSARNLKKLTYTINQ